MVGLIMLACGFIDMEQRPRERTPSKLEGRVSRRRNGAASGVSGPWPSLSILLPQLRSSPSSSSSDSSPDYSSEGPSTSQTRRNSPSASRIQQIPDSLAHKNQGKFKEERVVPQAESKEESATGSPRSNVRMEPNAPPPTSAPPYMTSAAGYIPQQHYEYVHPESQGLYPVDQPYYVSNEYNTHYIHEVPADSRYVVEQGQPAQMGYYQNGPNQMEAVHCNGYPPHPQPSSSAIYMAPGYPPAPGPSGAVYISAVPPQGYPDARVYPDQVRMSYPPGNRNVSQILHASRSAEQVSSPHMTNSPMDMTGPRPGPDSSPSKVSQKGGSKKRPSTTSLPSIPANDPNEPKKQFQCQDCKKYVSSARNLKRHENSCKAKKTSVGGPPSDKPASAGSPAKAPSPNKPAPIPQPPSNYPPPYPNTTNAAMPPVSVPYPPHGPPPPPPGRFPGYPQSAVPQANPGPIFEYPSTGMTSGMHSAPPVISSYNPPLPSYPGPSPQHHPPPQSTAFQQRHAAPPAEFNEGNNGYGFSQNMEAYLDTTIDEVGHNPLAFIGGADYDSGHSGEQSMSATSEFASASNSQLKEDHNESKPDNGNTHQAGASDASKAGKKSEKNTKPTDFQCDDCKKYMCSQRSLRRHRTTCKMIPQNNIPAPPTGSSANPQPVNPVMKEESKLKPDPQCHCGQSFTDVEKFESHKATCKEVKKEIGATSEGPSPFNGEKTLMPPPEAEESKEEQNGPQQYQEVKYEQPGTSNVTVGEHLRQIHGKPIQVPVQKKLIKKPPILNRKGTEGEDQTNHVTQQQLPPQHPHAQLQHLQQVPHLMQAQAIHMQYQQGPPHDAPHNQQNPLPQQQAPHGQNAENEEEANRKSEQVADVVNSVVEKIRRQNESWESQPLKRPAPSQQSPVQAKISRQEFNESPKGIPKQKVQNTQQITPQGIQMGVRPQLVMPPRQLIMSQAGYPMGDHAPTSAPPTYVHPLQPTPTSAPPTSAQNIPKEAVRYLCPECCKTYSCRKHMKNHRQKEHGLTDEQVEGTNAAKRVKVNNDGFIINPGYDRENELIRQRFQANPPKPSKKKTSTPTTIPQTNRNEDGRSIVNMQQPHSVPSTQGPSVYYEHGNYTPMSAMDPLSQSSESSTPQYEQLQPMPMDYSQGGPTLGSYPLRPFNHADDLDVWDQIKARVDGPFNHTRADELDVARIAADLKRSAEESQLGELQVAGYHQMTHYSDQMVVESRKPVELAEADSTYCEDLDDASDRMASSTMISKHLNPIGAYMTDVELSHQIHALEAPKVLPKVEKKTPRAQTLGKSDRKRPCPTCGRLLSTDYSLKRHSTKCKQNQSQGSVVTENNLENSNDSAPPEPSTDDSHSADPDSTTLNPPNTASQQSADISESGNQNGTASETIPQNEPPQIAIEQSTAAEN
ncbi:unnamed protein product [Bursaphelenchus xylophilus]|uniref:(pine wood nematode) hypothetical protein n=1 Tax=Bursaphelenchus xylophilus TaxID=6326 RepID=A0A1I7SVP2_BURXY|nr:unnamed protein product [Bursaphelenchus xylophilus]CAG9098025.1 unnamed protein product [Bursaphelenchus xylophilus]